MSENTDITNVENTPTIANNNDVTVVVNNTDILNNTVILNKLLEKIINDKKIMVELNINEKSLKIINEILNLCPCILNNICSEIESIIKDGKINANDIPSIILLCKDILNLYSASNKINLSREDIIDFIKTIVLIIVNSDIYKINDSDKDLILSLINLSVELLKTSIDVKKKCLFNCFKKK